MEFENSSKYSDHLKHVFGEDPVAAATQLFEDTAGEDDGVIGGERVFNLGKRQPINIIDRLISERDSQFSNFNEKIDRLRHGHSTTSFKDHRRGLNETIGCHSSSSKPQLHKVQEINWSK